MAVFFQRVLIVMSVRYCFVIFGDKLREACSSSNGKG